MANELPDPSTLTDEELDALLETGQLPEPKVDDDEKPDAADDEDKSKDKTDPEDDGDKSKDDDDKDNDDDKVKDDDKADDDKDKGDEDDEDPDKDKKPVVDDDKDKKPSRREQFRIRDLLEKYGPPTDKQTEKPKASGMDYQKDLDADPEVVKKLEDDRQAASDEAYNRGLEQMNSVQFLTRLEIDAPRVEAKYPQLDKNNTEKFKPEAATDVNLLFLRLAGYDPKTRAVKHPDMRYTDFADMIFGLANDLADTKVEEKVKEVKKQAAQTGLRPDGSKTKSLDMTKAPQDMTDEELDEYLKKQGISSS